MSDFLVIFFKKIIYININLLFTIGFTFLIIKIGRIKNLNVKYILWSIVILRFTYDLILYTPNSVIVHNFPEHGTLTIGLGAGLNLKTLTASLWDNYGIEFTCGTIVTTLLGLKRTLYISFFILLSGIYLFFRSIIKYFLFKKHLKETFIYRTERDKIDIYFSDYVESPFVLGTVKPAIVFPASFNCYCTERELNTVIEHEISHIKRKDHFIFKALFFLKTLFIYILPLNIVIKKLEEVEEQICDKMVVEKEKDKKIVASALLKVVEFQSRLKELKIKAPTLYPVLAFVKNKKIIEERIKNIYNSGNNKRRTLKLQLLEILTYVISFLLVIGSKVL